jgi:hypothetical protein
MTSDVAGARPLSPGSGEGQPIPGARVHNEGESGRPIKRARCRPALAHDRWPVALCGACVVTIGVELGSRWLELDVWLARPLPRYAARNFSIEKTVPRASM